MAPVRIDTRRIDADADEIRAFIVARNEIVRLPECLRHHRSIGVDRFFVVDNGSDDGTREFLLAQPDTHVFETRDSFAASGYGIAWLNALLDEFGVGHWCVCVDADEWLIYPRFETLPLRRLCQALDAQEAHAMFCLLLDMYPPGRLSHVPPADAATLLDTCSLFDADGYRMLATKHFPPLQIYGGPRERMFKALAKTAPHPPTISKVPLARWRDGARYLLSTHALTPTPLATTTGALLHFKFLADFSERARNETARGEHYAGALEYRAYLEALNAGDLTLEHAASRRWRDSADLVKLGLMAEGPLADFIDAR